MRTSAWHCAYPSKSSFADAVRHAACLRAAAQRSAAAASAAVWRTAAERGGGGVTCAEVVGARRVHRRDRLAEQTEQPPDSVRRALRACESALMRSARATAAACECAGPSACALRACAAARAVCVRANVAVHHRTCACVRECVYRKRFRACTHRRYRFHAGGTLAAPRAPPAAQTRGSGIASRRAAERRGAPRSRALTGASMCAECAASACIVAATCTGPSGAPPHATCPRTGLTPPHLRRDWAHSYHICAGTRRAPAPAARARMRRAANAPRMRIAAAYADNRYRYCREGPDNAHLPLPPRRERQQCIAHHAVGGGGSGGGVSARCAACARRCMIEAQPPQIGRPMHEFDLRVRADSKPTWYGMRWAWRGARRCDADSAAHAVRPTSTARLAMSGSAGSAMKAPMTIAMTGTDDRKRCRWPSFLFAG